MSLLKRLFRRAPGRDGESQGQSVIVHLRLSNDAFGTEDERAAIHDLACRLEPLAAGVGEYDGEEFGDGAGAVYFYGPDADALLAAIEDEVRRSPMAGGAYAVKRYGPATDPDVRETIVAL